METLLPGLRSLSVNLKTTQSFISKCESLISLELRIISQNFTLKDLPLLENLVIDNFFKSNLTLYNLPRLRVFVYLKQSIAIKSGVSTPPVEIRFRNGLHCIEGIGDYDYKVYLADNLTNRYNIPFIKGLNMALDYKSSSFVFK